jgi:hypothetical protein
MEIHINGNRYITGDLLSKISWDEIKPTQVDYSPIEGKVPDP